MDTDTVISDITDNNSIDSQKHDELRTKTEQNLNNLTNDPLKDKCKELGIKNAFKMKKPELVQSLLSEFMKLIHEFKDKKVNDLKAICKQYAIKFGAGAKKDDLYWLVLNHCSDNLVLKLDEIESKVVEESKAVDEPKVEVPKVEVPKVEPKVVEEPKLSLLEQLEKQRREIETKMQDEIKKQEEEARLKEEKQRQDEEEENKKREKEDAKKKKQSIPKNVRVIVWNHYVGENIIHHRCLCCKKVLISITNFEVGHVLSEKNGGTHEINNLRPICFSCNHSMGTENMIDFVIKYGLYIG